MSPQKLFHWFRILTVHADADFIHGARGQRIDLLGFGSRAVDFNGVAGNVFHQGLRHLTTGRIAGANEQDYGFHHGHIIISPHELILHCNPSIQAARYG